jgi:hypothetical protein
MTDPLLASVVTALRQQFREPLTVQTEDGAVVAIAARFENNNYDNVVDTVESLPVANPPTDIQTALQGTKMGLVADDDDFGAADVTDENVLVENDAARKSPSKWLTTIKPRLTLLGLCRIETTIPKTERKNLLKIARAMRKSHIDGLSNDIKTKAGIADSDEEDDD